MKQIQISLKLLFVVPHLSYLELSPSTQRYHHPQLLLSDRSFTLSSELCTSSLSPSDVNAQLRFFCSLLFLRSKESAGNKLRGFSFQSRDLQRCVDISLPSSRECRHSFRGVFNMQITPERPSRIISTVHSLYSKLFFKIYTLAGRVRLHIVMQLCVHPSPAE